jgi:hypothetical protein
MELMSTSSQKEEGMDTSNLKINFYRHNNNFTRTVIGRFIIGSPITRNIYRCVLFVMAAIMLSDCKKDEGTTNPVSSPFPVNQTIAADLIAKGVPADAAQFFASAKVETSYPDDTTIICNQTFPNGATRDITIKIDPNRQYTPTAGEIAAAASDSIPIYAFQYSSSTSPDSSTETIKMSFFVAKAGLPKSTQNVQKSVQSVNKTRVSALLRIASGAGGNMSFGVNWLEVGNKGEDVAISSAIEYATEHGNPTGPLGSIYQLASAISDVATALDVSSQVSAWLAQLKALLNCAANPTNQVARSDPNYSRDAVNKIESAQNELKEVSAVRFLNIMTETAAQLTPVTNILSIGMKQGFIYSEQTLTDYSINTIMREAQLAVVPCSDSTFAGNIDVVDSCLISGSVDVEMTIIHTQTKVSWTYDAQKGVYTPQGTYNFTYTSTRTPTGGGSVCIDKKTAIGNIDGTGNLILIDNPTAARALGYDYTATGDLQAQVAASYTCPPSAANESYAVYWLPLIKGFSTSGYTGSSITPICGGQGTETVNWSFSVPPK